MTIQIFRIRMLITTMAVAVAILAAACGGSAPEAVEIPVNVAGESMDPGTIRVKQGDMVTLKIDAEESGEFHLHGYDIEQDIDENEVANFYFVADATGRFRITFHHSRGDHEEDADKQDKEGDHGHEGEKEGANGHGEIFMSEVLGTGDSFSFLVADDSEDQTIPFHSHLHSEVAGSIIISHDAPESESVTIQIKDLTAHPHEVNVRPGTTIIWTNEDTVNHMMISGHHPDLESAEPSRDPEKEDHEEHDEGEETDIGFLEVGPR